MEISPCPVSDREYPHCPLALIDFINDTIHVRFLAIKQVPQIALYPSSLRRHRTAVGIRRQPIYGLFQTVVPAGGSARLYRILLYIEAL